MHKTDVDELQQNFLYMGRKYEAAIKEMKSQVQMIPLQYRKEYENDVERLKSAQAKTTIEFVKLRDGWTRNDKTFERSWDDYSQAIVALDYANMKWGNLISAAQLSVAIFVELMALGSIQMLKKLSQELPQELKKLQKQLETAKGQVTEVKLQMAFNLGLSATSLALGPVEAIGLLLVKTAAFTGASVGADILLGPEKFNAIADVNTAAGNVIGSAAKLSKALQGFASCTSVLITLKFDSDELKRARNIVTSVETQIDMLSKNLEWVANGLKTLLPKLDALQSSLDKVIKAYKTAIEDAAFAALEYQNIRKEPIQPR